MYLINYHRQAGMGLLQLLFVLTLIAILIASTMLYWDSVQRTQLVVSGEQLLNNIIQAAQSWQPEYLDQGKYAGISASGLLQQGGITKRYITNFDNDPGRTISIPNTNKSITVGRDTGLTTPWGGRSKVIVQQASPGVLQIMFQNIPDYACVTMANNINGGSELMHNAGSGTEMRKTDQAECDIKGDGIKGKLARKAFGATLTVWYYPDF